MSLLFFTEKSRLSDGNLVSPSLIAFSLLVSVLITFSGFGAEGNVFSWGVDVGTPTTLTDVIAVSSGGMVTEGHSLALRADGTVVAWGSNGSGQATVPSGLSSVVQVAAGGHHSLALKADGTVVGWGDPVGATVPENLSNVKFIAAGMLHSLAITQDGRVVGWGNNRYGQIIPPSGLIAIAVAGGEYHSLGLRTDDTVIGWGDSSTGLSDIPAGLNNVVAISDGYSHSLALKGDGTVIAWGGNIVGQLNIPPGLSDVIQISAGNNHHSLALRANGTVVAWGHNSNGQSDVPPNLAPVKAVSAGNDYSLVVLGPANHPPVCNAGSDHTVSANGTSATVQLDGTQSFDPDGDSLEFEWSVAATSGATLVQTNTSIISGIFPIGATLVTLTVTDGKGGVSVCEVLVTVQDRTPPMVLCTTDKIMLWPADHSLQQVSLHIQASDTVTSTMNLTVQCTVSSNEPDDSGGNGSFTGDVNGRDGYSSPVPIILSFDSEKNAYEGTVTLRAERGQANTRVYSIAVLVFDAALNQTSCSCVVIVPHDRRRS